MRCFLRFDFDERRHDSIRESNGALNHRYDISIKIGS